jgi:histidyl-tRNA synthetase
VFSFQDDDEQWISLRYDLTAPLARYVGERYGTDNLVLPYRSYRHGWVFRNEKPGPGRFRQFMQFDADTVGSASPAADAEMCMMAADTMEALGIERGQYVVKVNNRKVLDGVLESANLSGDEKAGQRLTVLRAIDKADKFSRAEVRKLLGPGRWDGGEEGKGDFTKGAGLSDEAIERILRFALPEHDVEHLTFVTSEDPLPTDDEQIYAEGGTPRFVDFGMTLEAWSGLVGNSAVGQEGVQELTAMLRLFRSAGYGSKRIRIESSVVRGLEYYTGPVYEVELLLDTKDEKGRPVRFGSVGGGGRYDGLVSRFRGEPVPATGFSIGVSRLQAALTMLGKLDTWAEFGPVVITVFDKERLADYQEMVALLRSTPIDPKKPNGPRIRAELYLGNPKNMGNQFKYADKRNSPCVIVQGSNEKNPGKGRKPRVVVKDLVIGAQLAGMSEERSDYLAKQNEAQVNILQKYLVKEVRKVLARHNVKWG